MDPEELPFDQYQRYKLVADLIAGVRVGDVDPRVLDVGGRTANLRAFLPDMRIDLVDVEPSEAAGLVLGDGSRLPFSDGSFDVVCAFDTLEHVPPDRRAAFVRECARVASRFVMLAGPYKEPVVDEAEELLDAFMREKLRVEHRYLREHRTNGLPVRAEVESELSASGCRVVSYGHGNIDRWLALMCMELYMDYDPLLRPLAKRFFRFYNERMYASDHRTPVYRHVVVAARPGVELPSIEGLLDPPNAPDGALLGIMQIAEDLVAFDRDQEYWLPEFERLKRIIEGVTEDRDGHKLVVEDLSRNLEGHKETVRELRAEVAGLRSEVAAHIERYTEMQQATAGVESELRRIADEYRTAYESTVAELRRVQLSREELSGELQALVAKVEREASAGTGGQVARLVSELELRDTELDQLRANLANRDRALEQAAAAAARHEAESDERLRNSVEGTEDLAARLERCHELLSSRKAALKRIFWPGRRPLP